MCMRDMYRCVIAGAGVFYLAGYNAPYGKSPLDLLDNSILFGRWIGVLPVVYICIALFFNPEFNNETLPMKYVLPAGNNNFLSKLLYKRSPYDDGYSVVHDAAALLPSRNVSLSVESGPMGLAGVGHLDGFDGVAVLDGKEGALTFV